MKYSIRCSLLSKIRKDGRRIVRLRVSWDGRRVTHYLEHPIESNGWDAKTSRPKQSQRAAIKEINELSAAIDNVFDRAHLEKRIPTEADIKVALGDLRPGYCSESLADASLQFIKSESKGRAWEDNTLRNYLTFRHALLEWNSAMPIGDFNASAVQLFIDYLYRRGDANPTVKKYHLQLTTLLSWCAEQGLLADESWRKYKPIFKGEQSGDLDVVYLTEDELRRVIALDLSEKPYLDSVRDVFLFCCFTGVRYSDVAKLSWHDIHEGYMEVLTKKTRDLLRIELNDFSSAILDKYRNTRAGCKVALPVISNQKMNDYLKEIGRLAHLDDPVRRVRWVKSERIEEIKPKWQRLTTHCGRKTFIVTALSLEIPAVVIMRWTGHTDYDSMRPYVKIVDKLKESSMTKFNSLLKEKKPEK